MTMNEKNKVYELTKLALDGLTTEEKFSLDWEINRKQGGTNYESKSDAEERKQNALG